MHTITGYKGGSEVIFLVHNEWLCCLAPVAEITYLSSFVWQNRCLMAKTHTRKKATLLLPAIPLLDLTRSQLLAVSGLHPVFNTRAFGGHYTYRIRYGECSPRPGALYLVPSLKAEHLGC